MLNNRIPFLLALLLCAFQVHAEAAETGYSAAGLYNLANSYARSGKPGMAVLNYERANLLAPQDSDIDANLSFVRQGAHVPAEARSRFDRIARVASPFLLSWVALAGLLLIGGSLIVGQMVSGGTALRRIVVAIGLSMIAVTLCNAVALWPKLQQGIVISAATPVRVSPVPMGDALFSLQEAETVSIIAEHEGFFLVRSKAGRTGWVSRTNVASVVPRK